MLHRPTHDDRMRALRAALANGSKSEPLTTSRPRSGMAERLDMRSFLDRARAFQRLPSFSPAAGATPTPRRRLTSRVPCPDCAGAGEVEAPIGDPRRPTMLAPVLCRSCNGDGHVSRSRKIEV